MKQVIIQLTSEITIVLTISNDLCQILRCGIPIWCGNHFELIDILKQSMKKI